MNLQLNLNKKLTRHNKMVHLIKKLHLLKFLTKKQNKMVIIDKDESIRPETTVESLNALRPVFKTDGVVNSWKFFRN